MNADSSRKGSQRGGYFLALGVASVVLLALLLFPLGSFNPPAENRSVAATTATSYAVDASSVIASAASHAPSEYSQMSSRQLNASEPGLKSGGFATFSMQTGSLANLTILVFDTPASAQTYIGSVIQNAKGLAGYTDVSSSLAGYSRYGTCYGFGETDPDGNGAVATGVCTKGNVYIQVHLVSPSSLSSAEGGMSNLVGAAYRGAG